MNILKFYPSDPLLCPSDELCLAAFNHVVSFFPENEVVDGISRLPQFIDCGDGLENVKCPVCGADIDSDDWACLMDAAYTEEGFERLDITLPCCGKAGRLDTLIYNEPCAFSCFEIDVYDANITPDGLLEGLLKKTGVAFMMLVSHI